MRAFAEYLENNFKVRYNRNLSNSPYGELIEESADLDPKEFEHKLQKTNKLVEQALFRFRAINNPQNNSTITAFRCSYGIRTRKAIFPNLP